MNKTEGNFFGGPNALPPQKFLDQRPGVGTSVQRERPSLQLEQPADPTQAYKDAPTFKASTQTHQQHPGGLPMIKSQQQINLGQRATRSKKAQQQEMQFFSAKNLSSPSSYAQQMGNRVMSQGAHTVGGPGFDNGIPPLSGVAHSNVGPLSQGNLAAQKLKNLSRGAGKRPKPMPINASVAVGAGIDPKRKVLYRNFHDIKGMIYLIEISRNAKRIFIVLFPNYERPEIFVCDTLSEKIFQKLLTDANGVFDNLIAQNFRVKYGRLHILGYHGLPFDPRKGSGAKYNPAYMDYYTAGQASTAGGQDVTGEEEDNLEDPNKGGDNQGGSYFEGAIDEEETSMELKQNMERLLLQNQNDTPVAAAPRDGRGPKVDAKLNQGADHQISVNQIQQI